MKNETVNRVGMYP